MAVTESAKHNVYSYFEETMGKERATTLMEMVSPTGWADVATKQDLQREITLLRTETTAEFKLVRTEMANEFRLVRTEMETLQNDLKATLYRALRTHTMATFGFYGIFMSLAVTLAR